MEKATFGCWKFLRSNVAFAISDCHSTADHGAVGGKATIPQLVEKVFSTGCCKF